MKRTFNWFFMAMKKAFRDRNDHCHYYHETFKKAPGTQKADYATKASISVD